jgi:hypothetical protein
MADREAVSFAAVAAFAPITEMNQLEKFVHSS